MNRGDNSWLGTLIFLLAYTLILSYAQEKDTAVLELEAYTAGVSQGLVINCPNPERNADNPVRWWAGTQNMEVARERLCKNYYPKKVK